MTSEATSTTTPLRLSVTLPGSASLGAYQAGAAAALAVVIRSLRASGHDVRLDAIGGSSAGSFVAMLLTHCLLTGRDAIAVLGEAWIDEVDMDLLRTGGPDAPLATDRLHEKLTDFLADEDRFPTAQAKPLEDPVTIQIGLTSLRGFTATVDGLAAEPAGISYVDWMEFELQPGHDHRAIVEPPEDRDGAVSILDAVMASATHPGGFTPKLLDRRADRGVYLDRGVVDFPDSGRLWYTDGGLIESQPIGRIVKAARRRTGDGPHVDGRRLHLVIDPRSSGPSGAGLWHDDDADPSWMDGLRRAASIVPTQALHDDLRQVAAVNRRLQVLDETVDTLAEDLAVGRHELRDRLADIGDLRGKVAVDVDMISPLLVASTGPGRSVDADDDGVADLLAGDFIGAFGGFLDQVIRRSDFALGWESTTRWYEDGLARVAVPEEARRQVGRDLDEARPTDLDDAILDGSGTDQLGLGGRWRLALLAARYGHVLVREALPGPPPIPSGTPDLAGRFRALGRRVRHVITGQEAQGEHQGHTEENLR